MINLFGPSEEMVPHHAAMYGAVGEFCADAVARYEPRCLLFVEITDKRFQCEWNRKKSKYECKCLVCAPG